MIDEELLRKLKIEKDKIVKLGFVRQGNKWVYNKKILNDEFILTIEIENNVITSYVFEVEFNERFALYDVNASGAFVAQMRKEYNSIIDEVVSTCCVGNVFKGFQTNKAINYIKTKYGDGLEFLWESSDNAIFRNKQNNKWYAAFLFVDKSKFGLDGEGKLEVLNLLLQKEKVNEFIDFKSCFPAYHMNKKSWVSLVLDNGIEDMQLFEMIDNSYDLSIIKNKKKFKG